MKNLLWLIIAAAIFFAYQSWQQGVEDTEMAGTPSWEEERPAVGGGPVREWQQAPGAISAHNRQAGKQGTNQSAMRNAVKKGLAGKSK